MSEAGAPEHRRVLVCFDYEAHWGMPFTSSYDLEAGTLRILEVLARHDTRAIFFTVGAIALERPDLIEEISRRGHEIAGHGWRHERLTGLSPSELERFGAGLDESDGVIEAARRWTAAGCCISSSAARCRVLWRWRPCSDC